MASVSKHTPLKGPLITTQQKPLMRQVHQNGVEMLPEMRCLLTQGLTRCLTTSRWLWIVSLLYGLLLETCGYSVGVRLLLMLQTCTGYVLCSSLLVALGMPCPSSSAQ
uniref:Uncharacterized protein n=1 Tax=Arundo donax TaxID=35708 RepID=A0A0A8YFE1_ARUDO